MSQFGDLVRKLRKERQLTLEDVARKIGSHKGYVSGIENGKVNPPSVKFIRKFSRLFKHDEKEMVRIAYVDKAPKMIREEIRSIVFSRPRSAGTSSNIVEVPLLNTVTTGLSTDLDDAGALRPATDATIAIPRTDVPVTAAAVVCDNAMERSEGTCSFSREDIVFLKPMDQIQNGSVVLAVFSTRNGRFATIRQVMVEQNNNIILQPFNKDYPLEFLTRDDLDAIYAVVGKLEMFQPSPRMASV